MSEGHVARDAAGRRLSVSLCKPAGHAAELQRLDRLIHRELCNPEHCAFRLVREALMGANAPHVV